MRTPYGAWRVTYTQGRWVVLSGPTSMVIMQPAPPAASRLVNGIWDKLLASANIDELSADLTAFRLDSMPNLAVFFWDDDKLYCLLRGSVRVLDADTSELLASGEGARTWYEKTLSTRRVYLPLDDVDPAEMLQLPLVVGAVEASAVFLDAEEPPVESEDDAAGAEPVAEDDAAGAEPVAEDESFDVAPAAVAGLAGAGAGIAALEDEGEITEPVAEEVTEPVEDTEPVVEEPVEDEVPEEAEETPIAEEVDETPIAEEVDETPIPEVPFGEAESLEGSAEAEAEVAEAEGDDERGFEADFIGTSTDVPEDVVGTSADVPEDVVDTSTDVPDEFAEAAPDVPVVEAPAVVDETPNAEVVDETPIPEVSFGEAESLEGSAEAEVVEAEVVEERGFEADFVGTSTDVPGGIVEEEGGPFDQMPPEERPVTPPRGGFAMPSPEPTQVLDDRPEYAPGQEPQAEPIADAISEPEPTGLGARDFGRAGTSGPWGAEGFAAAAASAASEVSQPIVTPGPVPAFGMQPPLSAGGPRKIDTASDHDGETVFTTGIAATHKPSAQRNTDESLVLAAVCALGHANAPGSTRCRLCGGSVDSHNPQLVNRPVLAVVATSSGDRLPLTGPILIGRAPSNTGNDLAAELLRVPSPNHDISRTHVRISPHEWQIEVSDLYSTNGTVVVSPSGQPQRLEPGQSTQLEVGGTIDLGDGQRITLMPPA